MQDLVKVTQDVIGNEEVQTVNARELWKTLEIRRDFSNWIKSQINSLGLEENFDLITTRQKRRIANGGYKEVTEYILTLDTAKHIAMASRTKKGKEVRLYLLKLKAL